MDDHSCLPGSILAHSQRDLENHENPKAKQSLGRQSIGCDGH